MYEIGEEERMRIAVIADLHHYARSLGDKGKAFDLRQGSDQKCLKETGAIIDAAFTRFKEENLDAVIIAGDISDDGETASHKEILEKLTDLNKSVPVFLTTATHDWCCDGNAHCYEGDEILPEKDVYTPTRLREDYAKFGADKCIGEYRTHLDKSSYCYELSPNLRLLAIEDDQDGIGASGYSEDHLNWLCEQIRQANEDGAGVIAFQHHLLLENLIPLINKSQKIGNNEYRAGRLADAGLRLIFVGHSHMQRTSCLTSESGNTITQINVGSLCGHPAPINYIETDGKTAAVTVEHLQKFVLDGEEKDGNYITKHTKDLLGRILEGAVTDCEILDERLRALGIKIKPLKKIYPIAKFGANKFMHTTVGKAGKTVNRLTAGKGIDKNALKEVADDKLIDYVYAILLSVFDGSKDMNTMPDAAKTVARDVASLPGRIIRKIPFKKDKLPGVLKITDQIETLMQELVYPHRDHQNTVVDL